MGLSMGTMIAGWYLVQRNVTSRHLVFVLDVVLSPLSYVVQRNVT
jgi:hypothetical protein